MIEFARGVAWAALLAGLSLAWLRSWAIRSAAQERRLADAALDLLRTHGDQDGRTLRDRLAAAGFRMDGCGFYQAMARLEDTGLARGWYVEEVVEGVVIKTRWYSA